MTPTFDFAAFLHSPSGGIDGSNGLTVAGPPQLSSSLSNDLIDTLDNTQSTFPFDDAGLLPDWASSTTAQLLPEARVNKDVDMQPVSEKKPVGGHYRSGIANHHLSQLRHCLPQLGGAAGGASAGLGGAGQRSLGGSHSSPSVPLSQAARPNSVKLASQLTIQERRRLSRRAQVTGTGQSSNLGSALVRSAKEDSLSSQAVSVSNLNEAQSFQPAESPVFNTNYSGNTSDFTKRAYSYSGFDLIGALLKVIQRPNPKIDLGPIDLSCSFTVSDAQHPDQPIVHCSDIFCNLTGYSREEIIGRNCRFLQAPDGQVEKGAERIHTDNGAVQHFQKHCSRLQECQTSLINYRRDGSPFINLVTVIPITWGDSTAPVFLVGFQVDLVEQPGAILERKPNGLYVVNYSQNDGPQSLSALTDPHLLEGSEAPVKDGAEEEASKKHIMAHELADLISCGSEDTSKWARLLLDNVHDLITVLSLKGTFLYVSPSVEQLLGYKAEELVGKSISEFCHPSDVVPVFRELKDSTSNASIAAAARHWARMDGTVNPPTKGGAGQTGPQVNLIMRMRHKERGHEWIENVGKLHLEQGKGRKVVISTGRSRPVYNLPWAQARRSLDHKGPGFWTKLSQDGLILSTSGSVSEVLESGSPRGDGSTHSLAGMHICDVVGSEAREAISSGLHSLNVTGIPHQMNNGVGGQAVTVMSTLIPSSAGGEGLPTIFMHTQRINMSDLGTLQLNKMHSQDANVSQSDASQAALLKKGEPRGDSVFGELSTHRSSSWVFELHQLKIANKKLREEIRAHQRRISGGRPVLSMPLLSPLKNKTPHKMHSNKSFLSVGNATNDSSGSSAEVSMEPSPSPYNSGSGSGSDSTVATSVISTGSDNPVASGFKRSRS